LLLLGIGGEVCGTAGCAPGPAARNGHRKPCAIAAAKNAITMRSIGKTVGFSGDLQAAGDAATRLDRSPSNAQRSIGPVHARKQRSTSKSVLANGAQTLRDRPTSVFHEISGQSVRTFLRDHSCATARRNVRGVAAPSSGTHGFRHPEHRPALRRDRANTHHDETIIASD